MKNKVFAAVAAAGMLVSAGAHADVQSSNLGAPMVASQAAAAGAGAGAAGAAGATAALVAATIAVSAFAALNAAIVDAPRPVVREPVLDPPGPAFPAFPPGGGGGDTPPAHTPVSHH